jgi:hypothetical protein
MFTGPNEKSVGCTVQMGLRRRMRLRASFGKTWGTRIRTLVNGAKGRCPATGRSPNRCAFEQIILCRFRDCQMQGGGVKKCAPTQGYNAASERGCDSEAQVGGNPVGEEAAEGRVRVGRLVIVRVADGVQRVDRSEQFQVGGRMREPGRDIEGELLVLNDR